MLDTAASTGRWAFNELFPTINKRHSSMTRLLNKMKGVFPVYKPLIFSCAAIALAAGCSHTPGASGSTTTASSGTPAPVTKTGVRDGMNAAGDVTDPTKVSCGDGPKIKGTNDTEGEILGKPAPGTKFNQVKIGMGMKQVTDIAGQPTDQGSYITGKAFIPFYFGGDRHRYEMAYKGWGRLIFAGGSFGDMTGGNLICVINYAADTGYR